MESCAWMMAPFGQALAQGASSHWRHSTGVLIFHSFTTFSRGRKFSLVNAPGCPPVWAITQAISQVKQPMHFCGSAITNRFIHFSSRFQLSWFFRPAKLGGLIPIYKAGFMPVCVLPAIIFFSL